MHRPNPPVQILVTLIIGSAHKEEIVHRWNIWAWNFGSNVIQWVSDIWNIMCAYDGWTCSIKVDVLMTNEYRVETVWIYICANKDINYAKTFENQFFNSLPSLCYGTFLIFTTKFFHKVKVFSNVLNTHLYIKEKKIKQKNS